MFRAPIKSERKQQFNGLNSSLQILSWCSMFWCLFYWYIFYGAAAIKEQLPTIYYTFSNSCNLVCEDKTGKKNQHKHIGENQRNGGRKIALGHSCNFVYVRKWEALSPIYTYRTRKLYVVCNCINTPHPPPPNSY